MLTGVRVLDFTQNLPGPFAGMRLAERGAEVVKVEPPSGDPARHTGENKGGNGLVYLASNRGKKSLCLDLKQAEGRRIGLRLARRADVLLEGFRPGVMDRLGLGYEAVSALNPTVVYASLTGYGREGVASRLGSHDLNYMALSGMLAQFSSGGKPVHPTILLADLVGGLTASETILTALYRRRAQGKGARLDLTLSGAMTGLMGIHDAVFRETGKRSGVSLLGGEILSYGLYGTKDGKWMALAALEPKFWHNFCGALGRGDWVGAQYSAPGEENGVYREVRELFRSRTREEWTRFGLETDCCLTPVLEAGEWEEHPAVSGKFPDGTESPSAIGGNTDDVLSEWLEAPAARVREWREAGIVR